MNIQCKLAIDIIGEYIVNKGRVQEYDIIFDLISNELNLTDTQTKKIFEELKQLQTFGILEVHNVALNKVTKKIVFNPYLFDIMTKEHLNDNLFIKTIYANVYLKSRNKQETG